MHCRGSALRLPFIAAYIFYMGNFKIFNAAIRLKIFPRLSS